jgi:hypothetical protein
MWLLLSVNNIKTMDIEVEQIAIIIDTNIPKKTKPDFLTKHIFYGYNSSFKDNFYEEYPFITRSVEIPKSYLLRKTFSEKVMFFFNRKTFIDTLSNKKNFTPSQEKKETDEIINYNLTTMIELLFTTVYPSINDNKDSFNKLILKRGLYTLSLDGTVPKLFTSMIPSLNVDFSYIILDGKEYTVTSTCILNDIINHPEYNKMIHKVVELKKWKIQTKNEIESKMIKIQKKIKFNIGHNFNNQAKVKYEFDKNKRNYSHYNSNLETEGKANALFILFNIFIDIIEIIENIDNVKNIDTLIENSKKDVEDERKEEKKDEEYIKSKEKKIKLLNAVKTKMGDKQLLQNVRNTIDKYTIDILKNIKTKLDDKYSFQTIRSLIDEVLMLLVIKLKYFDSKNSYNDYDYDTYKELVKYYTIDYEKYIGSTDDYDVVSGEIERYFKFNYKKYAELLDYISKFVFPNCETNNKKLQIMINEYFNNKNDSLEEFMTFVFHKYINDDNVKIINNDYDMLSLHTGVNSYNTVNNVGKLKYESYVSFDLILGKLTQDDLSNISCEYKDEELGIYFDMQRRDKLESTIHKPKLIEREKMMKTVIDKNIKVNGGKRNRRNTKKTKKNKRKTMKRKRV